MKKNKNVTIELREAIDKYIQWKSVNISSAFNRYLPRMNQFMAFIGANKPLNELSGDDVIGFNLMMRESGYSSASIAMSMRILRNFVIFWHGRRMVHLSPKEIIPPKVITPEQTIVEEGEFELMSDSLSEDNIHELQKKLAIHLLWDTGVRVSELLDIRLENIQPKKNGLRTAIVKTKKTDRYNLIAWGKETNRLLELYLPVRLAYSESPEYLFSSLGSNKSTAKLSPKTVQRWIRGLCERVMIDKNITPHSFRHGKAHFIIDNGGDTIDVQALLRHKNLESSLNYMRLNQKRYLARAKRYIRTDDFVKIPIAGKNSKTGTIEPQVVTSQRIVYNTN